MAGAEETRDIDAVVVAWAEAGCRLDEASRRAVVAAVVHALDAGRTGSWLEALYRFDPTLSITIEDARSLRGVLHAQLVAPRPPREALDLQLRLGQLIDELIASAAERRLRTLEQTAMVDPLTGLLNRRAFDTALASALAHGRRHNRSVSLAMVDLDGLKRINDTMGHAAGDDALRSFASAITQGLRAGDNAYRIGGDEFVVLAPDTTADDLGVVMRRIGDGAPSFSVGIAEMPEDGIDPATILSVADARLYGTRREVAAATHDAALMPRRNVALVALVLATIAALLAEGVRRAVGVEADGTTAAVWQLILFAGPVACAVAAGARGNASPIEAVRRGSAFAAVSLLAMIASMTPLFVRTSGPDGPRHWLAGGPFGSPASEPEPDETAGPPTTTTTVPDAQDGDTGGSGGPRTVSLDPDLVAFPPIPRVPEQVASGNNPPPVTTPPVTTPKPGNGNGGRGPSTPPVAQPASGSCTPNPHANLHARKGNGRNGQEVRCLPTPRRRVWKRG